MDLELSVRYGEISYCDAIWKVTLDSLDLKISENTGCYFIFTVSLFLVDGGTILQIKTHTIRSRSKGAVGTTVPPLGPWALQRAAADGPQWCLMGAPRQPNRHPNVGLGSQRVGIWGP